MGAEQQTAKMKFRKIAGNYQLEISGFADLGAVLALDDAFWALNSIDIQSLRMEKFFLECVDSDRDGRIRSDEIRQAVRFTLEHLRDGSGFDRGSDSLAIEAINPESPEGPAMIEAAKLVLSNLGRADDKIITLAELRSDREIKARTCNNGDGVISSDPEQEPEIAAAITLIGQCAGSVGDRSGVPGVDKGKVEQFLKECSAYTAWRNQPELDRKHLLPFGEDTGALWEKMQKIQPVIDNFFLNSETVKFLSADPERLAKKDLAADSRAPQDVRIMLEKSALAAPDAAGVLDLSQPLNPLFRAEVLAFFELEIPRRFLKGELLSCEAWRELKGQLAPFGAWKNSAPAWSAVYEAADPEALKQASSPEITEKLLELCENDLSAGEVMRGIDVLHKLILFQRDLLKLLNNFVTLAELFDRDRPSPLQTGTLVMDGRHFSLAIPVVNMAEHKKLVEKSDICVLYLELFNKVLTPPVKLLAVAVTSGSMQNLFVGKSGVFYGADGGVFDARVTAFVEQPVSVSEALKNPFYRFGSFIADQLNRLFAARTATAQKELGTQIASGKIPAPAAPAPAAPAGPNPSMLLMGGGIGIAALGSSVAFITRQLQNVSFLDILSVLLGILLIFGGPIAVMSLIKLYRRDLSRFLEAAGCAVNRRMRLSGSMGNFFTYSPPMPAGERLRGDLVLLKIPAAKHFKPLTVLLALLLILLCFAAGYWGVRHYIRDSRHCIQQKVICPAAPAEKMPCSDNKKTK